MVCAKHEETILKRTSLIDRFIVCNGSKSFLTVKNILKDFGHLGSVIKQVNERKYDVAIEPRGDFRYIYFMHFMKAKRKISFNYSGGECFLTDVIEMPKNYKTSHITDDKLYLLEQIGAKNDKDLVPELPITDELKERKQKFIKENGLENYKLIGIHPGAREKIRRYEKFDELLEKIHSIDKNIAFIIYEGINEEQETEKVMVSAEKCGAKAIKLKGTLEDYINNMSMVDAMICNDSSPAHVANAYKIPTTVIYGPAKPEGIRPYNNKSAILNCISIPLECKPCYKSSICPKGDYECFNSIDVDEVANIVLQSLKKEDIQ